MPYFFVACQAGTFVFQLTGMDMAIAKNEARLTCRNFLDAGSKLELTAVGMNKEYEDFASLQQADPNLPQQCEKASYFAIEVHQDGTAASAMEMERFREQFDRHYCRRIEFTDYADNFAISTSVSFGSTPRFAS